jgi:uncharacterized phage-like protein YoqJ
MIVAFTGHRPDKLPDKETGYKFPNPTYLYVCQQLEKTLKELKPDKAISGMALGVDQYAAFVCIKLGIPFIAAQPFKGQEQMWSGENQKTYKRLLAKATEVVIVSDGGYSPKKMQIRNEFMVRACDKLIAVWDGSKGGTANCVAYAKSINKPVIIIDPCDHKFTLDGHNTGDPICVNCLKYSYEI